MKTLTCDVCRKKINAPVTGLNYFYLAHRDICESCNDELQLLIKPAIRAKSPFSYDWYTGFVQESIEKAIAKGKFN